MRRALEVESPDPKSISHSITLPQDIWKREEITACLLRLSERAGQRARCHGHKGNNITLTIRHSDFTTFSRQATLPFSTNLLMKQ